ncbi:GQ67_00484T0 [Komagataella phaffii]|nr:GQ67_00484T0 [Komagataella phaffii]AOA67010.1 GQ68_00905T0 [Komagataella phaffii GS115]
MYHNPFTAYILTSRLTFFMRRMSVLGRPVLSQADIEALEVSFTDDDKSEPSFDIDDDDLILLTLKNVHRSPLRKEQALHPSILETQRSEKITITQTPSPDWHLFETTCIKKRKIHFPDPVSFDIEAQISTFSSSPIKADKKNNKVIEKQLTEPASKESPVIDLTSNEDKPELTTSTQKPSTPPRSTSAPVVTTSIGVRNIHTVTASNAQPLNSRIHLLTQIPKRPDVFQFTQKDSQEIDDAQPKLVKPLVLSLEQEKVIQLAKQGLGIFYTGSAGTGKSVLLRNLIKELKEIHPQGTVGVAASTGLAACNIGGQTLHSFTGIGLGDADVTKLLTKIRRNKKVRSRWLDLEVLIIDEISMIDGNLLDKLNLIAQRLRKNKKPFGGIQLIVCGDFYQLPPVSKTQSAKFAFEADCWDEVVPITLKLSKIFRQRGDLEFIDMLNEVRNGRISPRVEAEFQKLNRPLPVDQGITPTELYPTREEVERSNKRRLDSIPNEPLIFKSYDTGSLKDEEQIQHMLSNFMAPKTLTLKKGAQVMMIKNVDATLVNGSVGKVLDFIDPDTYLFYKKVSGENSELELDTIEQEIEAKILSNGKKLDASLKPSEKLISNASNLAKLDLDDSVFSFMKCIKSKKKTVSEDLRRKLELINTLYKNSSGRRLPLVRFLTTDGETRDVLVEPEQFSINDIDEKPLASRVQLPLILAWSLSIHKSQGQTLNHARIDLRRVFEAGQAYVALSRATSRKGIQVLNFNKEKIRTNPQVEMFYQKIYTVDDAVEKAKIQQKQKPLDDASAHNEAKENSNYERMAPNDIIKHLTRRR